MFGQAQGLSRTARHTGTVTETLKITPEHVLSSHICRLDDYECW